MKRDVISAVFWGLMGIWVCREGYGAGVGSLHEPGSGFLVLGAGGLLILLSSLLLGKALLTAEGRAGPLLPASWEPCLVMLGLFLYTLALEPLGFAPSTLILLVLLMKIVAPQPWPRAVLMALFVTLAAHLIFDVWLGSQLPRGILKVLQG